MGDRSAATKWGPRVALATALALALAATGCGSSSKQSASVMIKAGQVDLRQVAVQPPPGYTITTNRKGELRMVAGKGASNAGAGGSSTANTIPLAGVDPTTKFFGAVNTFSSCLKGLNVKFIGVPNASNPSSPANNPAYLKALSTCAAKSGIVQALKDQQSAQDNLTPAQIKVQNAGYLKWRDCMIGRGWGIPEPKPDSKGRLFSFGGGGGGGGGVGGFKAPPGQDITSSPDVSACASQVQKKVSPNSGG